MSPESRLECGRSVGRWTCPTQWHEHKADALQIFLLFKTLERSSWPDRLAEARAAYDSLRSHHLRAIQHPDEFESSVDPLTESEEVCHAPRRLHCSYSNIPNVDQY